MDFNNKTLAALSSEESECDETAASAASVLDWAGRSQDYQSL